MSRPISAIARYAACGGAGAAAYDCAVNEGSMLSHVIHQLVTSASSPPAGTFASSSDYAGSALHRLELADLSAKLDRLTSISMGSFAASRGTRVSLGALLCAAGAVFGGLAVWAIATGRWWPTIQAKLELVEQAIGLVDAKVDARASELSAQLTEQHAQVMSAVSLVSESVYELDGKLCKVERRIDDIDDTTKENNSGACRTRIFRVQALAPACVARRHRCPADAPPFWPLCCALCARRDQNPVRGGGNQLRSQAMPCARAQAPARLLGQRERTRREPPAGARRADRTCAG